MRWSSLAFLLAVVFAVFIGGGPGYTVQLPVRAAAHAALTVLLGGWLIGRIRSGRGLPATPINAMLYATAGVLALAAAFSLDPRMAVEHAWWPLVHGLIFFVCAGLLQTGRGRWLAAALFLMGGITVSFAGAEFIGWAGRVAAAVDVGAWLRGAAEFPPVVPMLALPLHVSTALAGFVTPQVVAAFAMAAAARQRGERAVWAILGAGLAAVLLGTGSRGGLLALGAAVITFLLLRLAPRMWAARHNPHRDWARLGTALAAVVLIGAATIGLVLLISRSEARSSGDQVRARLWSAAMSAAQDYPVLGLGPGLFGRANRMYHEPGAPAQYIHRQAHNIVLNTAAEEGLIGLLALGLLAAVVVDGWSRQRRTARNPRRALRLDAALAALVAVAVQAQFDVFFNTPFVGLVALLAAYAVTTPNAAPQPRQRDRAAAWAALALVAAYGLCWIPVDLAHAAFERASYEHDVAAAEQAAALDPALGLYELQIAYLTGVQSEADPARLPEAIARYEAVLAAEPQWDSGWLLLAGLYERSGRIADALQALDRAAAIHPASPARWNWARIADAHAAAPDEAIVAAYVEALSRANRPFAAEWAATPRRRAALEAAYASAGPLRRYTLAEAFFPERRAALVPASPATAEEWWIAGQFALTVQGDPAAAYAAFSQAVRVNPNRELGDYYAARARAGLALGPNGAAQAARDAAMAGLLTTVHERAPAPYDADRDFEHVLFGRGGEFRLPPALLPPVPGLTPYAPSPQVQILTVVSRTGELVCVGTRYRACP